MNSFDCSQCGRSARALGWGFTLLAKEGWQIAPEARAAERAFLCPECAAHAEPTASAVAEHSAPRIRGRNGRPLRVLLIDDHVLLLRAMSRLLTNSETALCSNPRQALAILLDGAQFDAIVCDVMMPGLSGPELFERCFLHSPDLARRFLFVSSDIDEGHHALREAAARVGAKEVPPLLSKPVSAPVFLRVVAQVAMATHGSGTYALDLRAAEASSSPPRPKQRSSSGFH